MKRLIAEDNLEDNLNVVAICDRLNSMLNSNGLSDLCWDNNFDEVFFEITGDWKHDHLYAKEIVANKLNEMIDNGEINRFEYLGEAVIGEAVSDYYTAIHSFYIN